jgi:hypothetical protein
MTSGELLAAYAYEVAPQQASRFVGGSIPPSAGLQAALDRTFHRSKIASAPAVTFMIDTSSKDRAHPIRDVARTTAFATEPVTSGIESLARRFADAMDNRSKPALLMASVHATSSTDHRRLLLWTFPKQEVFDLRLRDGKPQLDMLDAFNRESSLRKVALIEGGKERTAMLTARVLDFQASATERAVADLWIVKFLHARLQMSDAEGTQLVARSLRQAHARLRDDADAKDQINAAIIGLRASPGRRWSMESIASAYLAQTAAQAFLQAARQEERSAVFGLNVPQFDQLVQYRRFTLTNGVIVSAPFGEIGVDGPVQVSEGAEGRVLQASGVIEDEQVRTRG